jgi:hypothetical protein
MNNVGSHFHTASIYHSLFTIHSLCPGTPVSTIEQQLKILLMLLAETEDDSYHQQWERFRKIRLS